MFTKLFKGPVTGLLTVAGTVLLAPIVLPVVVGITRPVAKAALHLYFDLVEDVRQTVAEHQPVRRFGKKSKDLVTGVVAEGAQNLVHEVEVEAEESVAGDLIESLVEVLE